MVFIPPQATISLIKPAPMHHQAIAPVVKFPCKRHIARFIAALHHTAPDQLIELSERHPAGLTIIAQACTAEQYIAQQCEGQIEAYPSFVQLVFPDPNRFYLTDRAINAINRYLEAWFAQFVTFQICALRAHGITQAASVEQVMQQYDIDDTELSADAIKKMSYRARVKHATIFVRGKIAKK